jgi:hypothetical protein
MCVLTEEEAAIAYDAACRGFKAGWHAAEIGLPRPKLWGKGYDPFNQGWWRGRYHYDIAERKKEAEMVLAPQAKAWLYDADRTRHSHDVDLMPDGRPHGGIVIAEHKPVTDSPHEVVSREYVFTGYFACKTGKFLIYREKVHED